MGSFKRGPNYSKPVSFGWNSWVVQGRDRKLTEDRTLRCVTNLFDLCRHCVSLFQTVELTKVHVNGGNSASTGRAMHKLPNCSYPNLD